VRVARTAEVDHLDAAGTAVFQQHVLRFEVAVDDVLASQKPQTLDERISKSPDEVEAETLVVVLLDQLVQVQTEQFEADAQMTAEIEVVEHVNDVVDTVFITASEVIQNANLHQRLVMEPLLIPYDFDGYLLTRFVV